MDSILLARDDRDAALLEMQQETTEAGKQAGSGNSVLRARKEDGVRCRACPACLKSKRTQYAFEIAEVYAFRGQSDEAMHWLERAYAQKESGLYYVKVELPLKASKPTRYKAFLRKMNLPE